MGLATDAALDDGMGFSLVPWKRVIELRLGQQVAATVRGGVVSWEIGPLRGAIYRLTGLRHLVS